MSGLWMLCHLFFLPRGSFLIENKEQKNQNSKLRFGRAFFFWTPLIHICAHKKTYSMTAHVLIHISRTQEWSSLCSRVPVADTQYSVSTRPAIEQHRRWPPIHDLSSKIRSLFILASIGTAFADYNNFHMPQSQFRSPLIAKRSSWSRFANQVVCDELFFMISNW